MYLDHFFKKHTSIFFQLALLSIIALLFTYTNGWLGLGSTLLGGCSWILPDLYFKYRIRKIKMIFDLKKMLKWFFVNQALKLLFSFGIIILILSILHVNKKSFLIGYALMVLAPFSNMFFTSNNGNKMMGKHQIVESEFTTLNKREIKNEH